MDNNCVKSFCNPSTIVEVTVQTNLDGHTNAQTHGHTHIYRTVVVTTMSRSPQAGSTKSLRTQVSHETLTFPEHSNQ